ncbi:MAG: hypothetical protein GKR88_01540 [Flavobacteriaceae bacterium]|nr:MAG: hypothetical protein GKR88_01540 [Flavobacteriaceae bacterium]
MKQLLKLSFFTFLLISTHACKSQTKLSSEKAMTILTKNFKVSCSKRLLFSFNSYNKQYNTNMRNATSAEKNGLVTINKRFISGIGGGGRYEITLRPTEAMKSEYFVGNKKYRIADGVVTEILGISHDKNTNKATVRFSYKYRTNDLYYLRGKIHGKRVACSTETFEDEATFTLYDTGWRLDK